MRKHRHSFRQLRAIFAKYQSHYGVPAGNTNLKRLFKDRKKTARHFKSQRRDIILKRRKWSVGAFRPEAKEQHVILKRGKAQMHLRFDNKPPKKMYVEMFRSRNRRDGARVFRDFVKIVKTKKHIKNLGFIADHPAVERFSKNQFGKKYDFDDANLKLDHWRKKKGSAFYIRPERKK